MIPLAPPICTPYPFDPRLAPSAVGRELVEVGAGRRAVGQQRPGSSKALADRFGGDGP